MKTLQDEILHEITHQCDGPVTEFVAIYRAINLAKITNWDTQDIADALDTALTDLRGNGSLASNEFSNSSAL